MKPGDKVRFNDLGKRILLWSDEYKEKEYEVSEVVKALTALDTPAAGCDTYALLKLDGKFLETGVWTCFLKVVDGIEKKEKKVDRFEMVLEAVE